MDSKVLDAISRIAETCHELNRVFCLGMNDHSQVRWTDAPDWQRQSAFKGVLYHYQNPWSTPADSHNSWLEEKLNTGWSYGEVKDPDKKTHPCIVPFEELPLAQQTKDIIFHATVKGLLDHCRETLENSYDS